MLKASYALVVGLSVLVGYEANAKPEHAIHGNGAAHEQAIRKTNDRWLALIRSHDAVAVSKLYTADGAIMAPGAPIAQGQGPVEKAWDGLMKAPGFGLTFKADQIVVSSGGDMALDRGTYLLSLAGPHGPTKDIGKYVVVWRRIDGQWKVAADIFNSDGVNAP